MIRRGLAGVALLVPFIGLLLSFCFVVSAIDYGTTRESTQRLSANTVPSAESGDSQTKLPNCLGIPGWGTALQMGQEGNRLL
jgi:hypothetical protein